MKQLDNVAPFSSSLTLDDEARIAQVGCYLVADSVQASLTRGHDQEGLTDSTPKFCPTLPFTSGVRKPSRLFHGGIMN